jgi:hypothetical protein
MVVISVAIALTAVFGVLAGGADQSTGQEGFAPDNAEIQASERIGELFGQDSSESVMQVIVTSDDGDVLTADALAAVRSALGAVAQGETGDYLSSRADRPQPFVSFLAPVEFAAEAKGFPLDGLGDYEVKQIYEQTLADP